MFSGRVTDQAELVGGAAIAERGLSRRTRRPRTTNASRGSSEDHEWTRGSGGRREHAVPRRVASDSKAAWIRYLDGRVHCRGLAAGRIGASQRRAFHPNGSRDSPDEEGGCSPPAITGLPARPEDRHQPTGSSGLGPLEPDAPLPEATEQCPSADDGPAAEPRVERSCRAGCRSVAVAECGCPLRPGLARAWGRASLHRKVRVRGFSSRSRRARPEDPSDRRGPW